MTVQQVRLHPDFILSNRLGLERQECSIDIAATQVLTAGSISAGNLGIGEQFRGETMIDRYQPGRIRIVIDEGTRTLCSTIGRIGRCSRQRALRHNADSGAVSRTRRKLTAGSEEHTSELQSLMRISY